MCTSHNCTLFFTAHSRVAYGDEKGRVLKKSEKSFSHAIIECQIWPTHHRTFAYFLQGTHHHICVCAYLDPLNSDDGKLLSSFNHHASSRPKKKNTFWLQISYRHKYLFWHALLMLQPCLRPKGQNHTQTKIPLHCYRELLPHIHTPSKEILIQFREGEREISCGWSDVNHVFNTTTRNSVDFKSMAFKENLYFAAEFLQHSN